jgi:L-cysteine desulfidase
MMRAIATIEHPSSGHITIPPAANMVPIGRKMQIDLIIIKAYFSLHCQGDITGRTCRTRSERHYTLCSFAIGPGLQ